MADDPAAPVADPVAPPVDPPADPTPEPTSWLSSLPDDLKGDQTLGRYATVGDLAKAHVDLRKLDGSRVTIPGDKATDDERRAFFTRMGCPEKVDGYEMPGEIPEGMQVDEALKAAWFAEAHSMGLNRQQAARVAKFQMQMVADGAKTTAESDKQHREGTVKSLQKEWGAAYEERVGIAKAMIDRLEEKGAGGLKKLVSETPWGDEPAFVKAMYLMGRYAQQDEILGKGLGATFAPSPDEAKAQLAVFKADTKKMKAMTDVGDAGHKAASDEWQKLQLAANASTGPEVMVLGAPV